MFGTIGVYDVDEDCGDCSLFLNRIGLNPIISVSFTVISESNVEHLLIIKSITPSDKLVWRYVFDIGSRWTEVGTFNYVADKVDTEQCAGDEG